MERTILITIIVILAGTYLLEVLLSVLNLRNSRKPMPAEIGDLYTPDKRTRQLQYQRTNIRFGILTNTIGLAFSLLMVCGGFAWLNNGLLSFTAVPLWHTLLFFVAYLALSNLVDLPASIYDTFYIEAKFGFNTTTPWTFAKDTVISFLLSLLMQCVLMTVLVLGWQWQPDWLWLSAWVVVSIIMVFLNLFYPKLIVPLFNKQTPLPEGELREAIEAFARKADFKVENIYVMDSSKRSTKANAYFTGFGKRKRIVLYDTLIAQLTTDEIVAVLSHEIGHEKHRHTLRALGSSLMKMLLLFVLLGVILRYDVFAAAIGCYPTFVSKFIVFMILYQPVSMILSVAGNVFSRRHEYQADAFAKEHGMGRQLVSSLKKMTVNDLGNPLPHPLTVFLTYSHPTLAERIRHLES
ncbi:MAG: M48 family metallopeptidase [Paludibacteraceae bacterium]|nr:M48 family metallopeptidase [Paludibacteraceae bacterium]